MTPSSAEGGGLALLIERAVFDAYRAPAYDAMLSALYECEAYLTDREDVVDGSYGEPAPNREMSLLIEVSAAIKAAEGVKP